MTGVEGQGPGKMNEFAGQGANTGPTAAQAVQAMMQEWGTRDNLLAAWIVFTMVEG